MRICIDPGHGGRDNGGGSNSLFREDDLVLRISLCQEQLLLAAGYDVFLTRRADTYLSLPARARKVRESGAAICLCNHINNVSDPAARGLEVFHSIHAKPDLARAIAGEILALGIIPERSGDLGPVQTRESRTRPGRDYYYMHRNTGAVRTVIIEYGFASNPADAKALQLYWRGLAEAAVKAIVKKER